MNIIIELLKIVIARMTMGNKTQANSQYQTQNRSGKRTQTNLMADIMDYLSTRYEFRYNIITEQTEFRRLGDADAPFLPASQRELNTLCIDMHRKGIRCWDKDIVRYLHSTKIADYHPFRLYMEELPAWDGKDRLTDLARRVSDDEPWARHFHRWMLGMAAQWLGMTGAQANSVAPILISREQGMQKSTFCKSLLPDTLKAYYTDSFDLTAQSRAEQKMAETGLINMDEFDKYPANRQPQLKNIMQTAALSLRKAYQRNFRQLPRVASFIATSNRTDLLTDTSGSRRFICVEVRRKIDCENIEHKQIFAQLKAELEQGERHWFSAQEEQELQERNKAYNRASPALDLFLTLFRKPLADERPEQLSLADIIERMRLRDPALMRRADPLQLSRDILSTGVVRKHTQRGNRYLVAPSA